jgi:hypothetical protein
VCGSRRLELTTKRGYGSASVAVRVEKRAIKSDKLIVLFSETETAKQNQKFPFHFFFRFAVEGWGEETRGKCKEIFLFLALHKRSLAHATEGSGRGAHHWSSEFNSKYIRTSFNTHRRKAKIEKRKCLVCVAASINRIDQTDIFHNRIYRVSIIMSKKYRPKYQNLVKKSRQARHEAKLTQVEAGKNSRNHRRIFQR